MALDKNQSIVKEMMAVLGPIPSVVDETYRLACVRSAAFLGKPILFGSSTKSPRLPYVPPGQEGQGRAVMRTDDAQLQDNNVIFSARNNVFDVIAISSELAPFSNDASLAKRRNPFVAIGSMTDVPDQQTSLDLVELMSRYAALVPKDGSGLVSAGDEVTALQMSSATVSLPEDEQSSGPALGSNVLEIELFSTAFERLLDFKRRVPRVMFTADYSPSSKREGSLVGWRRVGDASGYIVERKEIFTGEMKEFVFTNSDMAARRSTLGKYVSSWVLSFYSGVIVDDVCFFLDTDIDQDREYLYSVSAYQDVSIAPTEIFSVPMRSAHMTNQQKDRVRNLITSVMKPKTVEAFDDSFNDGVSPYPFIAQVMFGNSDLDWMIAAINVTASRARKDPPEVVGSYSFLAAKVSDLFAAMDRGDFFVPRNFGDIVSAVEGSIVASGVSQTVSDIMRDSGVVAFFEGDSSFFKGSEKKTFIETVLSAIDPDSATVDMGRISSLVIDRLAGVPPSKLFFDKSLSSKASEIDVPGELNVTDNVFSEDAVQFFGTFGRAGANVVDLVTVEGIGTFVRALRTISDFGRSESLFTSVPIPTLDKPSVLIPPDQTLELKKNF